jgi:hypothetical protein
VSGVHRLLTNPFYAGLILWKGAISQGAHQPMLSLEEFDRVQRQLRRPQKERPVSRQFPFTGLITCGECGFSVTAEVKRNRFGTLYTYYHCSKRRLDYRCTQGSVTAEVLERMLRNFLVKVRIKPRTLALILECAREARSGDAAALHEVRARLEHTMEVSQRSLNNLATLRVRDLIGDEEFVGQRAALEKEVLQLRQSLAELERGDSWFEPVRELFSFGNRAVDWFNIGDHDIQRQIVRATGSNPVLRDKNLSIEAKKPLFWHASDVTISYLRRRVDDIRNAYLAKDPLLMETLELIRDIKRMLPPEVIADPTHDSLSHAEEDEARVL